MNPDSSRYVCLNCSHQMDGLKCKIRCPRCGYFESCSDLEPAPPIRSAAQSAAGPRALRSAAQSDAGAKKGR